MRVILRDDAVEVEIVLLKNGSTLIRKEGCSTQRGTWSQQGNTLEIDMSDEILVHDSEGSISFKIYASETDENNSRD